MVRAAVLLLALGLPAGAAGEVVPLTDETVIAEADSTLPATTGLAFAKVAPQDGGFVVAWTTSHSRYSGSELIGWSAGISARKVAADGQPAAGGLTLAPQSPQVDIFETALAPDPSGGFAVVWSRFPERHPAAVWLRRFSPAGSPLSTVALDSSAAHGVGPALAPGVAGRLFAVWGRPRPSAPAQADLFARLILPSGQTLPRFQVTARAREQGRAVLGTDGRGNALLVYENPRRQDTSELFLRTYDGDGQSASGDVRVAATSGHQHSPALAVRPDGRFVVVWQESRDLRLWARLFDPPYRPLGPPFPVSGEDPPDLYYRDFPAVAFDREGRFLVAWQELSQGRPHVEARAFDARGTPLGAVFEVDQRPETNVFGPEMAPAVAAGENGTFLVVWEGPDEEYDDKVYSRLYAVR